MTRPRFGLAVALFVALATPLDAKTLTLTDEDCDRMAQIGEAAPRSSWLGSELSTGVHYSATIDLAAGRAFLIRFPIDEIPKDQKITKAELTFSTSIANNQTIQIRRVIAPWGAGVSWQNRSTRPKKVEWATPGGKSGGKDRVTKPTAFAKMKTAGEVTVNLTEDVELWYSGAATNEGWIFTVDDPDGFVRMTSPTWTATGTWKLRITYEPRN
jgi:hypothetical protein